MALDFSVLYIIFIVLTCTLVIHVSINLVNSLLDIMVPIVLPFLL